MAELRPTKATARRRVLDALDPPDSRRDETQRLIADAVGAMGVDAAVGLLMVGVAMSRETDSDSEEN